ncbi:hypothetical protein CC80DRAFT_19687 [Byssothecium circinans]|uniref:Rhodopsin domain-containing protein n=1 Tax=Byssothecium circinans TaxID=147558 RepID=A0A6A5U2A3_9PLEO|nr:hypothetical protein CC80DRAFT_19687 [Byssothecium circinans]
MLHVRVTDRFPRLNAWAISSVYVITCCWIFIMVTVPFGCFPPSRKWYGLIGKAKPCPSVTRQWDFWTHLVMHVITDIWLCILPFPALAQMKQRRLRIAVFCVYSITFCSVIVSIVRAILLSANARSNADAVRVLSMIEVSTTIIVGAVPCISSVFTKKFVNGNSSIKYSLEPVHVTGSHRSRSNFTQLGDAETDDAESRGNNSGSFSEGLTTLVVGQGCSNSASSTENIIGPREIQQVTVVTVASSHSER